MEGMISLLCQNLDINNKENIPPFLSINKTKTSYYKLGAKMTLKKDNKHRKPLKDITNLVVESMNQSSQTLPSRLFPLLKSGLVCIWIDSPSLVKSEFLSHFKNRFEQPNDNRLHMDMNFSNTLNSDQVADLECQVSKEEIKKGDAVTCFFHQGSFPKGGNSSFVILIPKTPNANMVKDYRPISLIGSMYKIISKILANRLVVVLGDLVNEIQSAFVADKKILDGPFILNELVQWCKKKKKQSMVFKVDFEKAYDSVRWDHLDDIMRKFGFGEKWCMWIQSFLRYSRGSVIVNGSPTEEFQFYKGLKQGDSLSPFLFILVMESLHISFQRVVDVGLFKGIELAPSLNLSHMFYADDAIFMGQWSESNIDTIVQVLECFNYASGLRINMTKSKLLGISVEDDKVEQAAEKIGCNTLEIPFSYLGSKVGWCMSHIQTWNETIERMANRLSKWKLKTFSIGGRLTLLKSVLGSMPIYHMSISKVPKKVLQRMESMRSHFFNGVVSSSKKSVWVKWKHALASKDKGGLGVSSLFALNRALMFKWVWRFITQGSSLWARVIKALHGNDGKIGLDVSFRRPPRGGVEQFQFEHLKVKMEGCILADMMDRWFWALKGSGDFTVASVRKMIDDFMLPEVSSKTRWIKAVPIKVNVHAWKVKLDGLPTRLNISRRGIDIESILCPMCGKAVESTSHIFFTCQTSSEILRKISRWWDIDYMEVSSYEEWLDWILNMRLSIKHKQLFEGVCYVLWWHVWSFRNKSIFGGQLPYKALIFDDVVSRSFYW
ncbi:RNA-directed DNA polymerase, eukaryota, partial [Tanacetum coccineum]